MQIAPITCTDEPDSEREASVVQFIFLSCGSVPFSDRATPALSQGEQETALFSLVQDIYRGLRSTSGLREMQVHTSRSMTTPHVVVMERWDTQLNLEQANTRQTWAQTFTALHMNPLPYPLGAYSIPSEREAGQPLNEIDEVSRIPGLAEAVEMMIPPFFAETLSEEEIEVLGLVQGTTRRAIIARLCGEGEKGNQA